MGGANYLLGPTKPNYKPVSLPTGILSLYNLPEVFYLVNQRLQGTMTEGLQQVSARYGDRHEKGMGNGLSALQDSRQYSQPP